MNSQEKRRTKAPCGFQERLNDQTIEHAPVYRAGFALYNALGVNRKEGMKMARVRVEGFTVSLDGYGAGPNQDIRNPLGEGGQICTSG